MPISHRIAETENALFVGWMTMCAIVGGAPHMFEIRQTTLFQV